MSTPIIGDDFKAFPGGQLFATGETLEVSAAMGGITMAVADLYRAVEGQEGFDPLLARQACSILVRVNAADGTPVKNLGHVISESQCSAVSGIGQTSLSHWLKQQRQASRWFAIRCDCRRAWFGLLLRS